MARVRITVGPGGVVTGCEHFPKAIDYLKNGDLARSKEAVNRQISGDIFHTVDCSTLVVNSVAVEMSAVEQRSHPSAIYLRVLRCSGGATSQ